MVDGWVNRPDPARWLRYASGGKRPERYFRWRLHDLTLRTWPLRHLIRAVVQVARWSRPSR
jgi:hypothetical protein